MSSRILHVVSSLDFSAIKQWALLADGLRGDEFEVQLCLLERDTLSQQYWAITGVKSHSIRNRWSVDPLAFAQLKRQIRRIRPHVVHTWEFTGGVYGRLATCLAGVPSVDVPRIVHSLCCVDKRGHGWQWAIDRRLGRAGDRLVTHSAAVRDICVEHGLPANQLVVIPSGVAPARPSNVSRAELLRELRLPSDARLIGAVGQLHARDRTTDLVWAADLIRVLHDNMRLLVIGDGPERPQLERFARLASDLDHIRFLGMRDDQWRIVPHLDVLWHGSAVEGPSLAVMEAMVAGVPVVACNVASRRELVIHGQSGFLVPVAGRAARVRATDRIFRDGQLAQRLGAAAKARMAESFGIAAMVDRYVSLYREILAGYGKKGRTPIGGR